MPSYGLSPGNNLRPQEITFYSAYFCYVHYLPRIYFFACCARNVTKACNKNFAQENALSKHLRNWQWASSYRWNQKTVSSNDFSPFVTVTDFPHLKNLSRLSLIHAGTRRSGFVSSAAAAGSRTGTGCCSRRRSGPYSCSSSSDSNSNSNNNNSSSRGPSPWCRCLRLRQQQQQPCPAPLVSPTSENHFLAYVAVVVK